LAIDFILVACDTALDLGPDPAVADGMLPMKEQRINVIFLQKLLKDCAVFSKLTFSERYPSSLFT